MNNFLEEKSIIKGIDIVGFKETRNIGEERDQKGDVIDTKPIVDSERAFIDLKFPNGLCVCAEISYGDWTEKIEPLYLEGCKNG